ncbi:MAG: TVP38/TMEM64 family protein, partial [Limisphaerales bacterium]
MKTKIKDLPWKWIGLGVALIGLIVASRFLPLGEWTKTFSDWIKNNGAIGYIIFVAAYVVGTILFFPASLMTIAAGLIFGLAKGIAVALSSATLGASLAFLIGRHLARGMVEKRLGKNEKFQAVNDAIGEQG